jgi:predicted nucleic acid-binding Zn ribbon protein
MVFEIHAKTLPPFTVGRKLRIALPLPMAQFHSVKCAEHQAEAIGICAYCGRALCAGCARPSETRRLVCSNKCAAALSRNDQAVQWLLQKSVQNAQASAFYCYLCGGLSLGAAVAAHFVLPLPFLIYFAAACGIVFIVSGIWYGRTAKKQISNP